MSTTDTTITMVEIVAPDGATVAAVAPEDVAAALAPSGLYPYAAGFRPRNPEPVTPDPEPVVVPRDGVTILNSAVARIDRLGATAADTAAAHGLVIRDGRGGWAEPRSVFPKGTATLPMASGRLREARIKFDDLPTVLDALASVAPIVQAEGRRDVTVDTKTIRLDADGGLISVRPSDAGAFPGRREITIRSFTPDGDPSTSPVVCGPGLGVERDTFDSLLSRVCGSTGGAEYLAERPTRLRSALFNAHAEMAGSHAIKLRTRLDPKGRRSVFAVVGRDYPAVDADYITGAMAAAFKALPGVDEMRGSALYDPSGSRLRIDAAWHAPADLADFAAGDAVKVGIRLRSRDDGGGSIQGSLYIFRNLCVNFVITGEAEGIAFKIRHHGDRDKLIAELSAGIARLKGAANDMCAAFAADWRIARTTPLPTVIDVDKARKQYKTEDHRVAMIRAAISRLSPEQQRDIRAEAVLSGWDLEDPSDITVGALINAVTRVHEILPIETVPAYERAARPLMAALLP